MESTLREYNSLQKRNFGVGIILPERYFHISLPIITKHELVSLLSDERTVNVHETANPAQPNSAHGSHDRRTASEAEKLFHPSILFDQA